jgi:IS5 family transposase
VVDFELFRGDLERAVPRSDGSKGGRPAFDHVLMFKVLILQASYSLSDERAEYLIRDRLSFMTFTDFGIDTLTGIIEIYKADPDLLKRSTRSM